MSMPYLLGETMHWTVYIHVKRRWIQHCSIPLSWSVSVVPEDETTHLTVKINIYEVFLHCDKLRLQNMDLLYNSVFNDKNLCQLALGGIKRRQTDRVLSSCWSETHSRFFYFVREDILSNPRASVSNNELLFRSSLGYGLIPTIFVLWGDTWLCFEKQLANASHNKSWM